MSPKLKRTIYIGLLILAALSIIPMFQVLSGLADGDISDWALYAILFDAPVIYGFLIWNIVIWAKQDKNIPRFFALIILGPYSSLVYAYWVLKRNWL